VDLSLHKLATTGRKRLKQVMLFQSGNVRRGMLMVVHKPGEVRDSFAWA